MTKRSILALFLSLMIIFSLFAPVMASAVESETENYLVVTETTADTDLVPENTIPNLSETTDVEESDFSTKTTETVEESTQIPNSEDDVIYAEFLDGNPDNIRLIRAREVEDGSANPATRDTRVTITKYSNAFIYPPAALMFSMGYKADYLISLNPAWATANKDSFQCYPPGSLDSTGNGIAPKSINGEFTYCLAAQKRSVVETSYSQYSSEGAPELLTDWSILTDSQQHFIRLIIGYGFPNANYFAANDAYANTRANNNINPGTDLCKCFVSNTQYNEMSQTQRYVNGWKASESYAATQLLIWEVIMGYRDVNTFNLRSGNGMAVHFTQDYATFHNTYNGIVAKVQAHGQVPSFASSNSATAPTYTLTPVNDANWDFRVKDPNSNNMYLTDVNRILEFWTLNESPIPGLKFYHGTRDNVMHIAATEAAAEVISSNYQNVPFDLIAPNDMQPYSHFLYYPPGKQNTDQMLIGNVSPDPVHAYIKLAVEWGKSLQIGKVSSTNASTYLGGAVLQLKSGSTVLDEWTTIAGQTHSVSQSVLANMTIGNSYTIHEVAPPPGYATATDVSFTLEQSTTAAQLVTISDTPLNYQIVKLGETGSTPLAGAKLVLLDSEYNQILAPWVTTTSPYQVPNGVLVVGKTYIIRELEAPSGYTVGPDYSFTVENTTSLITVNYRNSNAHLYIAKVDDNDNYVAGATLELKDGVNLLERWTSQNQPHAVSAEILAQMEIGHRYSITETHAPTGYIQGHTQYFTYLGEDTQTINVVNHKAGNIYIQKTDQFGEPIDGAILAIYCYKSTNLIRTQKPTANYPDISEIPTKIVGRNQVFDTSPGSSSLVTCVASWTASGNNNPKMFTADALNSNYKYLIVEISAPDGCKYYGPSAIGTDHPPIAVQFTPANYATSEEPIISIQNEVQYAGLTIEKVDPNNQQVPNATLALYRKETHILGNPSQPLLVRYYWTLIDTWNTSDSNPKNFENLPVGEYKVVELSAPDGFRMASEHTIRLTREGVTTTYSMVDEPTEMYFEKVNEDGSYIEGATVAIYKKDGSRTQLVTQWITSASPHLVQGLVIGQEYIFREISVPANSDYILAEDITFIATDNSTVTMVDVAVDKPDLRIRKVDAEGNDLLGATFELQKSKVSKIGLTWTRIKTWTNITSNEELIENIEYGTYRIVEITAPNGYYLSPTSEPFQITEENNGQIFEIEIVNEPTKIGFLKVDQNGNPAAGATLQLLEYCDDTGDETLIDEWESYGSLTPHYIEGRLLTSSQAMNDSICYILREVTPPEGCEAAEDIWFDVPDAKPADGSPVVITMINEVPAHVFVNKVDENGNPVAGAELSVYTNEGANGSDVLLCSFTSTTEPYDVGYIKEGVTVTVVETKTPTGYSAAESATTYEITSDDCFSGTLTTITVVNNTKYLPVYIEKQNSAGIRISGAQFDVYTMNPDETEYSLNTSFTSSATAAYSLGSLRVGTKVKVVETAAPDNYTISEPVFYTVTDSGQTNTIIVTDMKLPLLYVNKVDATTQQALAGATLKVEKSTDGGTTFTAVTTFKTTSQARSIGYFVPGTIIRITETAAPASYRTAPVLTYTVTEASYDKTVTLTVEDYPEAVITGVHLGDIFPAVLMSIAGIGMIVCYFMVSKKRKTQ